MNDYHFYNKALENVSQFELEVIAKSSKDHEERFMTFLRYIQLLDQNDPKKTEGSKFIKLIFDLDQFKAFQNQSLQIFENESQILEEEGDIVEEEHPGIQSVGINRNIKVIH